MHNSTFQFQPPATHQSSPESAIEALYAMGYELHSQDRLADAAGVFRIMLQLAPEDERSWLALGECHERIGQTDIALELYGAGTVAIENAVRCEIARFRLLHDLGRTDEADEAFDTARSAADGTDDDALIELVEHERTIRP